jgi:branched-chain amino acid transport system permease protein
VSRPAALWLATPLLATPAIFLSTYRLGLLALVAVYTLAALAQNLLTGYGGIPSLGNVAFFAISAYTTGSLIVINHAPIAAAMAAGVVSAGLLGLIVGVPALRISGMHLAIVTVALVFVAQEVMLQWDQAHSQISAGITVATPPPLLQDRGLYLTAVLVSVVGYLLVWNMLRSRSGRAIVALGQNPIAAAAAGVNVTLYRLIAFVLSGLLTGVAGAVYLYYGQTITPPTFSLDLSLAFLTMIIVGGRNSLGGSVLGGLIIGLLPQALALLPATIGRIDVSSSTSAIYAVLLLLTLRLFPDGIWNSVAHLSRARLASSSTSSPLTRSNGVRQQRQ